MALRIAVKEDDCIGCGLCEERAPNNIEVPSGAMCSRVKKQPVAGHEENACNRAVDYCPSGALSRLSLASEATGSHEDPEVLTPVTLAAGSR